MTEREKVMKGLECCTADLGKYHQDHFCDMCPYKSTDPRITYCFNKSVLMRDALSLLKAQEPRVIDADEIVLSAEPSGWLWLETRNGHCGEAFKSGKTISGWINFGHGFDSSFTSFIPKDYGKTWRCWTSRPTDEQREAVKWGG